MPQLKSAVGIGVRVSGSRDIGLWHDINKAITQLKNGECLEYIYKDEQLGQFFNANSIRNRIREANLNVNVASATYQAVYDKTKQDYNLKNPYTESLSTTEEIHKIHKLLIEKPDVNADVESEMEEE